MLRWGAVGVGDFFEGTIAPAMAADPNSSLAAVASRDEQRGQEIAARWGAEASYTRYEDMLESPGVDVVYVATPNAMHARQVIAAAGAGKHVFCEKPLGIDPLGAAEAVEACRERRVALGIDFHNRYLPWVQDVTGMIAGGAIGDVVLVEVDVGSGPRDYQNWRADPALAGLGSVHNVGVHALDFLGVILGSEPNEVLAMFDETPGRGSVEMLATILLRFDDGTLAYANCNERLTGPTNTIRVHGTEGTITGSGLTRSRVAGDLHLARRSGEESRHYPVVEAHRLCLEAFTTAVIEGREPVPSGVDGLRSARLCAAIVVSAGEGRLVAVEGAEGVDG
jgi:1,5-anhydro-D-fructose reductase (1,5-anhydro-D-mannitol-forming)